MTARQPNSSKPARSKKKPMIPCSKEADIAEIKTKMTDLEKIVKGNGIRVWFSYNYTGRNNCWN